MKESTRVLLALGIGLGGGAAVAATGNPDLLRAVDTVAPIGTLWVNAIRMTIIPLVVSLLITGGGEEIELVQGSFTVAPVGCQQTIQDHRFGRDPD